MNSTNAKSIFWKVIPISLLLLLVGSMSFVLTPVNAGTSNSGLPPAYIEIRAVRNYGIWVAPYETTSSVITMITNMRASTGNRSLNLYAIVSGPQSPTETVGTTTLDSFLVQAKQASGGRVIPDLNLNYYTSDIKSLPLNQKSNFCDPHNKTFCGPAWFFQVSTELLSLNAVSSDPQRTINLDAWDQFNRDVVTAGLPPSTPFTVLQQLKAQGWVNIMLKTENYFPAQGNAWAQGGAVVTSTSSPYVEPDLSFLSKIPQSERAFLHFDRQIQNSPKAPTALATFLSTVTRDQQGVALTSLASLQGPENYTFIYPVLTYTTRDKIQYTWDATVNKQSNGQPFVNLIGTLITQYGIDEQAGNWKFNEGSGTSTADSSGNRNTGTLVNSPSWLSGSSCVSGNCLSFASASNQYAYATDSPSLDPTSAITVSTWVNPTTLSALQPDIIRKDIQYNIEASTTQLIFSVYIGGAWKSAVYGIPLSTGTWTNVVGKYDGANIVLYVNGAQAVTVTQTGAIGTSTNALTMGRGPGGSNFFNGKVDDVRIYSRALTSLEVVGLYQLK